MVLTEQEVNHVGSPVRPGKAKSVRRDFGRDAVIAVTAGTPAVHLLRPSVSAEPQPSSATAADIPSRGRWAQGAGTSLAQIAHQEL